MPKRATAPLDSERALAVVRILNRMVQQYRSAIIIVTHDKKIIPTFKRASITSAMAAPRNRPAAVPAGVAPGFWFWSEAQLPDRASLLLRGQIRCAALRPCGFSLPANPACPDRRANSR